MLGVGVTVGVVAGVFVGTGECVAEAERDPGGVVAATVPEGVSVDNAVVVAAAVPDADAENEFDAVFVRVACNERLGDRVTAAVCVDDDVGTAVYDGELDADAVCELDEDADIEPEGVVEPVFVGVDVLVSTGAGVVDAVSERDRDRGGVDDAAGVAELENEAVLDPDADADGDADDVRDAVAVAERDLLAAELGDRVPVAAAVTDRVGVIVAVVDPDATYHTGFTGARATPRKRVPAAGVASVDVVFVAVE